jgi:hypothetical protein
MSTVFEFPRVPAGVQVHADTADASQQIAAFLAKHPGLLEVITEGLGHLHQAFPESQMDAYEIDLEADREVADWEYLVIRVKTALPVETAHARITAFDETWLLDHSAKIGGRVIFDVEYV